MDVQPPAPTVAPKRARAGKILQGVAVLMIATGAALSMLDDTNAWFQSYSPSHRWWPVIAVGVILVDVGERVATGRKPRASWINWLLAAGLLVAFALL
jgi:hypothetical protein